MIYTKNNGKKNPILDGNAFAICCKCGKEISVSLNELFRIKKDQVLLAEITCSECTMKLLDSHQKIR